MNGSEVLHHRVNDVEREWRKNDERLKASLTRIQMVR